MKKTSFNERLERLSQSRTILPPDCQDQVLSDIRDRKCHIVKVEGNDQHPSYAYSVGLWHHFGHPEFVTFSQPEQIGEQLIDDMQKLVKVGQPPVVQPAQEGSELNYPVKLHPIDNAQWARDFLPLADWFYDRESFPVLELFPN
ncbi:MAG: DUF4262 domain-containing protein [Cyanobacteria bacterium P01_A01_bin.17]